MRLCLKLGLLETKCFHAFKVVYIYSKGLKQLLKCGWRISTNNSYSTTSFLDHSLPGVCVHTPHFNLLLSIHILFEGQMFFSIVQNSGWKTFQREDSLSGSCKM